MCSNQRVFSILDSQCESSMVGKHTSFNLRRLAITWTLLNTVRKYILWVDKSNNYEQRLLKISAHTMITPKSPFTHHMDIVNIKEDKFSILVRILTLVATSFGLNTTLQTENFIYANWQTLKEPKTFARSVVGPQ